MTVRTFVIGELCVSPYNVRTDGRSIGALDALKQSILKRGLLMPLVVHGRDPSRPLRDGEAIVAPIGEPFTARSIAEHRAKDGYGLTQSGVDSLRSLRRELLRGVLLLADVDSGGTVARDYLIWGQLRMILTNEDSAVIGLKRLIVPDRDAPEARELIQQTTQDVYAGALSDLASWPCFIDPDPTASFLAYRELEETSKSEAAAMLACIALERSLNAEGYRIPLHDLVAAETASAEPAQLRELHAFTPTAPFFNLFSKEHRLDLALPFVGRDLVAGWARRRTPEQNGLVARLFVDQSVELLDGMDAGASSWVHPLLSFAAIEPSAASAALLQDAAK